MANQPNQTLPQYSQVYRDYLARLAAQQANTSQPPSMSTPLPPQQVPTLNPPTMSTPLPPQQAPTLNPPSMSTPTPPTLMPQTFTPPSMSTPTPPQQVPGTFTPPNMSTPLPPSTVPTGTSLSNINIPSFSLPPLDGSSFVANTTSGLPGSQFAPANVIAGIASQLAATPGATPATVIQQLAARFNTTPSQMPIEIVQQIQAAFAGNDLPNAANTTMTALDTLLSGEGSYITNARRRGIEQANSRGLMNSSIAAGASQRAALEAAQPILNQIMGLNNQREAQDFQGRQNAINQAFGLTSDREGRTFERDMTQLGLASGIASQDRQNAFSREQNLINQAANLTENRENRAFSAQQAGLDRTQSVNNQLLSSQINQNQALLAQQLGLESALFDAQLRQGLQQDTTLQQDWLSSRNFTREFNAALSMLPLNSALDLSSKIQNYALDNPEVYTPNVISGMTNFFNMNMLNQLATYFPNIYNQGNQPGGT